MVSRMKYIHLLVKQISDVRRWKKRGGGRRTRPPTCTFFYNNKRPLTLSCEGQITNGRIQIFFESVRLRLFESSSIPLATKATTDPT